ncbi:AMP-binding protein [Mycolicibacterium sp.]|uniref:AMP-binding protein n=3 Tax=Mycolicibacterium sp. TaxID=2320850 RepID=UPI003D13B141
MSAPFTRDVIDRPVIERFAAVAAYRGAAPAISDADGVTSYRALAERIAELAADLDASVPAGAPVAVDLPTGRDYLAAMFAALATDRPYVPIDTSYPPERNAAILAHAGATHVFRAGAGGAVELAEHGDAQAIPEPTRSGPAYIAYTSGSTGEPKGVWQDQRGLLHDVWQYVEAVGIGPADTMSMLYSPSVVGAVRDIYGALLTGAELVVIDLRRDGVRRAVERLAPVTILHAMPPVLRTLAREAGEVLCPAARLVYVAGDQFDSGDLALLRSVSPPDCDIYTGIGSSECSTLYRHWIIPRDWRPDGALVPVGYPIAERAVELVDDHGDPVPPGDIGRIVVTSEFLAQGYWRTESPRLAAVPGRPGVRRFDTGDYGRLRPDGLFEFHGRADRQIKVRGFRFEPAALEYALRAEPEVADARVVVLADRASPTVVAVTECGDDATPELGAELGDRLRRRLPPALVPHRIVAVAALPRLPNFKIDDRAVRALVTAAEPAPAPTPEPGSPLAAVVAAWEAVTGAPPEPATTFGSAGGDSLRALEFEVVLDRAGFVLPPGTVDAGTTATDAAAQARPKVPAAGGAVVVVFPPDADFAGGRRLVAELQGRWDAELVALPRIRDEIGRTMPYTLGELARRAADDVLDRHPADVPLVLFGHSSGCRLAWETAAELIARRRPVALVAIGDGKTAMRRSLPAVLSGIRSMRDVLDIPRRGLWVLRRIRAYRRTARLGVSAMRPDLVRREYELASGSGATVALLARRRATAAAWVPRPAPVPVAVFTSDRWTRWELRRALGWRTLGSAVQVVPVGGGHDFLSAARVAGFADLLGREIDCALGDEHHRADGLAAL